VLSCLFSQTIQKAFNGFERESGRNGQRKKEPAGYSSHAGNIGKVDCQRLTPQQPGRAKARIKMNPLGQQVSGDNHLTASRGGK